MSPSPTTFDEQRAGDRFAAAPGQPLPGASVIVPCHNEEAGLVELAAQLTRLRSAARQYRLQFVLVDDGSTDETWRTMLDVFGGQTDVTLLRHETNLGIAAAISTGLRNSPHEIAASLDADCTYDPALLAPMLALLSSDVDLVVASPYHPRGTVEGVPPWRLLLSRLASRLYRLVLNNKLHTFTSCVRVYRTNAVAGLPISHGGFVGIVELLWQLDRRGGRIVEHPARLTVRKTGQSKLRIAHTAWAHLRLIACAAWLRLFGSPPAALRTSRLMPLAG